MRTECVGATVFAIKCSASACVDGSSHAIVTETKRSRARLRWSAAGGLAWAVLHFPGYPPTARADPRRLPASIEEILAYGAFGLTPRPEIRLGHRAARSTWGRGAVPPAARRAKPLGGRAICAPTEK